MQEERKYEYCYTQLQIESSTFDKFTSIGLLGCEMSRLTLESVTDRSDSGRWRFSQYSGRGILEFLFISQFPGRRVCNKDSENTDKNWKTRRKAQTLSNQELLFPRSPADWTTQDCHHQRWWVKLYHVSSQSLCLRVGNMVAVGHSGQLSPLQPSDSITIKMQRMRLVPTWTDNATVQWMALGRGLGRSSALQQNQIFSPSYCALLQPCC